jgi:hypothetical protein
MNLREIVTALGLEIKTGENLLDRQVRGGYAGDLLSDVLAHAKEGDVWITLQTHVNIVAVATAKNIAAIIIVQGRSPEPGTLQKAAEEQVPIFVSNLSTYDVVCMLSDLGIRAHERV